MPEKLKNINNNLLIAIVGPTSSGKSELAVKIAKRYNGEIISADSRQIYRGLNIGSGKVPKDKKFSQYYFYKGVRHHLLDIVSPKKVFTAAQYQKLTQKTISGILKRGKLPILCGGTGFYIKTVVENLKLPAVKPNFALRKKLEKLTTAQLFALLKQKDARRAQNIDSKNRIRLIRALEITETIGKVPPLESQSLEFKTLIIGIKKDKKTLQSLIARRLAKQLKQGLVKEVKNLHQQGLSWRRLENLGLEYRWIAYFLQNKINRKEMIENLQKEIWHYARRQLTYFRKIKNIRWIKNEKEAMKIIDKFLN